MKHGIGIAVILSLGIWPIGWSAQSDPLHSSSISIEYFGEQASPLFPVVIGDSPAAAKLGREAANNDTRLNFAFVHVVDPKVMAQLIPEVEAIPTHEIEVKRPYVVFHVVVLKDGHREVKELDGDQTFGLVERFKDICGHGPLFDDLAVIQRAIKLYEGK